MNLTVLVNLNGKQIHSSTVPLAASGDATTQAGGVDWLKALDFDLSPREVQVLQLIATGLQYKQVAIRLGITERTVRTHVMSIFRRTGISNNTMLVSWAWLAGLITEADVIREWRAIAPHLVELA
jgi:DNA-binding CsgD family transcriptional regulator